MMLLLLAGVLLGLAPTVSLAEEKPAAGFDAKHRAEGEQLLGQARDWARVTYSKTGKAPESLTAGGEKMERYKGEYFNVTDKVYVVGNDGKKAAVTAEPVDKTDGFAINIFTWFDGGNEYKWYDTFDALKKAHADVEFGDDEAEEEEAGGESDAGKQWDELYKAGASWIVKMDFGMAMWQKTEVVKVDGDKATVNMAMKFKEADDWMPATESQVERPKKIDGEATTDPKYKELGKGTEKIKDWDTNWLEFEYDGVKSKIWTSTKYGQIVKMTDKDGKVTMELIELNAK
jgi:hypothetical protein